MFCNRCGAENPDDAAFCSTCGASVRRATPAGTDPPPPPPGSTPAPLPPPPSLSATEAPAPPPGSIPYSPTPPGRSVGGLTTALTVMLAIGAGLAVIQCATRIYLLSVLDGADDPGDRLLGTVDDAVTAAEGVQAVALLAALTILVLLVVWTWRARSNLDVWGVRGARLPTGMAIGSWFIPFFWYLGPYWSMSDAYRGADPELSEGEDLRSGSRCGIALAWWIVWSAANALLWIGELAFGAVADTFSTDESSVALDLLADVDGARIATGLLLGGDVLLAVAGVLGLLAVRRIGARQRARLDRHRLPA